MRVDSFVKLVHRVEDRHLVIRERVARHTGNVFAGAVFTAWAARHLLRRARVINLKSNRVEFQQVGEIAAPVSFAGHGAIYSIGLFSLDVLGGVVAEKEEEFVSAVEEPGHAHGTAG